ncbi:hypothetical protein BH23ACT11_BH23ACT11_15990 [soil metagenome]
MNAPDDPRAWLSFADMDMEAGGLIFEGERSQALASVV